MASTLNQATPFPSNDPLTPMHVKMWQYGGGTATRLLSAIAFQLFPPLHGQLPAVFNPYDPAYPNSQPMAHVLFYVKAKDKVKKPLEWFQASKVEARTSPRYPERKVLAEHSNLYAFLQQVPLRTVATPANKRLVNQLFTSGPTPLSVETHLSTVRGLPIAPDIKPGGVGEENRPSQNRLAYVTGTQFPRFLADQSRSSKP